MREENKWTVNFGMMTTELSKLSLDDATANGNTG